MVDLTQFGEVDESTFPTINYSVRHYNNKIVISEIWICIYFGEIQENIEWGFEANLLFCQAHELHKNHEQHLRDFFWFMSVIGDFSLF